PMRPTPRRTATTRRRPTRRRRGAARTSASSSNPPRPGREGARLVEGVDGGRAAHGPAEGDEAVAPQHQAPDVPVVPVLGVFEAEAALESEPPVLAAAQAQAVGMHGLVEPLHACGDAGVAAGFLGALGGGA